MKKFTLLLMTMFAVSIFAVGQIKLLLHLNDTEEPLEFIATTVDSITFAGTPVEPEEPEDPEKPEDPDNPIKPEDPNKYENGYEYVDLGLSVMWATCNVGAKSPEEMGDSYSWGGTKAYINAPFEYEEDYPWKNENGYTKYNSNPEEGIVDNKTKLDLEDDAAHVKMGGKWRLPSENEIRELVENCIITITTKEGVEGLVFTAQNGNSIFIPIIKESYHKLSIIRSSELYQGDYRLTTPIMNVWDIDMDFDNYYTISTGIQEFGREALIPVRGVFSSEKTVSYPEPNLWVSGTSSNHEYVDLGLSVKWATCNLGASSKTGMGMKYRWAETTPTLNDNFDYDSDYNNFLDEKYNNKTTLAKEDDAAYASWGGEWRTPTFGELLELREKCIWKQVMIDNVKGFQITGPNGNAIFLPLNEDWSDYMSSTTDSYNVGALTAGITDAMEYTRFASLGASYATFYNRPVLGEQNRVTLRLDANNGTGEILEITDIKGSLVYIPKYPFTRTGYDFNGWNTKADGTGSRLPFFGDQYYVLEGITAYAQWIKAVEPEEDNKPEEYYTPEIENPGEGKVTICVRTPEKMCGTIATPGYIASGEWQVGNAYENGQALELLDGYDNWYIGTFDYSDDYFNEFKIVATDESGNWTWSNQTNDYEIKSGDCTNNGYSQQNIQIEHDDQVIFIVINSFQVNPCEEVAPAGLATFNLTPIGFPEGTEFYVTGSFDDYYWEWQELIEEFKLTLQSDGTYSAQIEVPESFTYRYIPVHPDESFDPMYPERDLVMPVNLITNDTIEYFEEEYEYQ